MKIINLVYRFLLYLGVFVILFSGNNGLTLADTYHVWGKVEIILHSKNIYSNPYKDVIVWVDLKGPGFEKRCYGFWDGSNIFQIRVLAAAPGKWTWKSGSNQSDKGLNGVTGNFTATPWSEADKQENPNRRGMVKSSANGHAFQYSDDEPYFLLGDTWWAGPTFRYRWYDDDNVRPIGPDAGFKDYVKFRQKQGYNCIAMISAFPNWLNDDQPAQLKMSDGTVLRDGWKQPGTKSAKNMTDENGNRAFQFPGKISGFENYFPDVDRINPEYFRNFDKKIDYLNAHGFIPFIEVTRRDIGQAWKKYYNWPDSYTRYIQYIWSRYQANMCFYSPIHFDWSGNTIPADDWNQAANKVIEVYGSPPFGTLASCNSSGSSLFWFDHRDNLVERAEYISPEKKKVNEKAKDKALWITFHQIGNWREHNNYAFLTDIFNVQPPLPGLNGEPYYSGMDDVPGESETAALYCRSCMYGSVLSGGLGGHIYGAGGWDGGMWGGNVEDSAKVHIWDTMDWQSANQMQYLKSFVLSEGTKYQNLIPSVNSILPNKSGEAKSYRGWAYCASTANKDFFLLYFEKDCPQPIVSGALPDRSYKAVWFNPRTGDWSDAGKEIQIADSMGKIILPNFPGNLQKSNIDWALKLTLKNTQQF